MRQIQMFLDEYEEVPLEALTYLTGDPTLSLCMYGNVYILVVTWLKLHNKHHNSVLEFPISGGFNDLFSSPLR